jgi:hypothetical protein
MEMAIMTGHALLRDQVVEGREQPLVGPIGADDEWRGGSGDILLGYVNRHSSCVWRRMAGRDDQLRGIGGIDGAKRSSVPRDARIDLAVGRIHRERLNRPLRHTFLHGHLRRGVVGRPDDEVPVRVGCRNRAVR